MRNGFGFESCKSEVMQETRRGIFAPECFECALHACFLPSRCASSFMTGLKHVVGV